MNSMSDYLENAVLNVLRGTTFPAVATNYYAALFSAAPSDTGGGTEIAVGAYARVAVSPVAGSWNAPAGAGTSNVGAISFPQATADYPEVVAAALLDASSGGNMWFWNWLTAAGAVWAFTALASTDVLTAYGHTLANGDRVVLKQVASALPTGLSADTVYYVVGVATDTFQLSLTSGGAAINFTANGAGVVYKLRPRTILNGDTPRFNAADFSIVLN